MKDVKFVCVKYYFYNKIIVITFLKDILLVFCLFIQQ